MNKKYEWCVVGAGPAGIASVGLLLDAGIGANKILWIDPDFQVGDFGRLWGEVSSNTSVELFLQFLEQIKSFNYDKRPQAFGLDGLAREGFTQLKKVAEPLQWVTEQLCGTVDTMEGRVEKQFVADGYWNLQMNDELCLAEKVILATGAEAKSLGSNGVDEISLSDALTPSQLSKQVGKNDTVAVYGASHSAMIIIRNLLEAGAKKVVNFYLSPIRYAVRLDDYTLYDNTGLKGETAKWVKKNISQQLHPQVERFMSNQQNTQAVLPGCDKVVYAIGFNQRAPGIENVDTRKYDTSCGIIAPGLFGTGIAFPRKITDPNGNEELNVGLWKFLQDLRLMLPIWMRYGL